LPDTDYIGAWGFNAGLHSPTDVGEQIRAIKTSGIYAWAVRSCDVSAVPVPAAVWLFGTGFLGLIGVARRKAA